MVLPSPDTPPFCRDGISVARSGRYSPSGLTPTNPSTMNTVTSDDAVCVAMKGFNVSGSWYSANVITPPRLAWGNAGTGHVARSTATSPIAIRALLTPVVFIATPPISLGTARPPHPVLLPSQLPAPQRGEGEEEAKSLGAGPTHPAARRRRS